ncbi:MAG TPA: (2Fe-2S)-binding protein [Bryobacteraceae bacterium]|nr:(2Fe-2S)-binding protein [Bryobacteraceae bacterium]
MEKGFSRRGFFNSLAAGATEAALIGAAIDQEAQAGGLEAPEGETVKVVLEVNGQTHTILAEPRWTLLHVLRDRLGFTGTKQGCERGECGACTVLIDGMARNACLTLAVEASGRKITTIEGLMDGAELGPVQQAFLEEDGYQCGYCTSGQMISAEALLRHTPSPTPGQIREGLSGNLCRCGAYGHIFRAVHRAAELKQGR